MVRRKSKHITSNDPLPCAHAGPNPLTISDPSIVSHRWIYGLIHTKFQEVHTGINLPGKDLCMHRLGWENAELLLSDLSFVIFLILTHKRLNHDLISGRNHNVITK